MKQKLLRLTRLRALVLTAVMCVLSAGQAWAAEEVYKTARFGKAYNDDNSSYTGSFEATNEGFVVTVEHFNNNRNAWTNTSGYGQIKCGRKSYESVGIISTKEAIDQAITKVVVTIDAITASSVNSIKLYTSSNGSSWTAAGSFTKATGAQAVTLATPAADLYYKIEFDCKSASSNGVITVSKVEYYYNTSGASAPTISSDNVEIAYDATSGSIAYTINNEVTGGTISASVPSGSWITLGNGTSSPISFTCEANSSAVARTETVTLTYTYNTNETVTKDVTVTQAGNPNGSGSENNPYNVAQARAAIDAGSGTQGVYATGIVTAIPTEWSTQHSNITFNIVDQSGDSEFLQAYRCVSTSNADASTIAVGDIVVVYGNLTKYNTTYEFGQDCQLISLTHPTVTVEAPTFSPAAGTYADAQNVTISCATDGASIYYTTDGTVPSSASTKYTGPIAVSTYTTIKAIAINGSDKSTVATASYHFCSATSPYTVTEALAFSEYPANGIYVSGIVSTAPTQAPTNSGQMTYYISVDGQATNQLEVYKGLGLNQAAFTAQDDIQVGDEVTIYGNVKVYNNTIIEFDSDNYLVAFNRPSAPVGTIALKWNNPDGVTVHIVNAEDNSIEYSNGDKVARNTTIKVVIDKPSYYEVSSLRVNDGTQNFDMASYANWVFTVLNDGDITISIEVSDTRAVTDLSYASDGSQWDASTQTVTISSASEFVQPALFINNGTPIDSEITYSSSNTAVATVATNGVVAIVGPGTAVITATFAGNNDYQPSSASFNIVYNGTVVDYAELPFAWAGGAKADLNAVTGVTTTGLGSDYGDTHDPYLVKLDTDGDYIQVKTNERPGVVTIGVKMIGGSNTSTITVQGSADGTTFTDVQELTISGKQNAELTLTTTNEFAETDRYVRLLFTKGSNVGVGPISIAKYTAPSTDPVINASDVNITAAATEGEITYTINNSVTGTTLTATSSDTWISNINVEADKVTFDCEANTGDERRATITLSYTGATDKEITVTQAAYVAPFTPTTYTLATAITSGKHYIIVGEKEGTYKAMGEQKSNNRAAVDVTVANDQATVSSADVKEVVIYGPTTGGLYTIYDASTPGYLYAAGSSSNNLKTEAAANVNGCWEITFDDATGEASIKATKSSNRNVMQYNSDNSLFSCYATDSQAPVYLYEKVSDTPVAASYTRTATAGNYGTICLPYNATVVGAELYSIAGVDDKTSPTALTLDEAYFAKAGVPYIFKATDAAITAYYTGEEATTAGNANGLIGSFTSENITNAAGEPVTAGENPYVIKNNKFCKAGMNVKVGANKAYINLNDVPVSNSGAVKMFIDSDADAIDGINGEIRSGVIYNIAGQRLQRPVRGINIINGKKVLVK